MEGYIVRKAHTTNLDINLIKKIKKDAFDEEKFFNIKLEEIINFYYKEKEKEKKKSK